MYVFSCKEQPSLVALCCPFSGPTALSTIRLAIHWLASVLYTGTPTPRWSLLLQQIHPPNRTRRTPSAGMQVSMGSRKPFSPFFSPKVSLFGTTPLHLFLLGVVMKDEENPGDFGSWLKDEGVYNFLSSSTCLGSCTEAGKELQQVQLIKNQVWWLMVRESWLPGWDWVLRDRSKLFEVEPGSWVVGWKFKMTS